MYFLLIWILLYEKLLGEELGNNPVNVKINDLDVCAF